MSETLRLFGGDVLTPFELIEDGAVVIVGGVIEAVGPRPALAGRTVDREIDVSGRLICPGFVDLQVNGGGGALLTEDASVEAVERMARAHVRSGTTSLLPTVVTAEEAQMARSLAAVSEAMRASTGAARVLGAHLEGPFLNPVRRGAHDERSIAPPSVEVFERLRAASDGALRLITLAPELPGAPGVIGAARAAGAVVAIGHTDATYDEARRALDAGATLGTHGFNAMRGMDQREPGAIGALLDDERAVVSLIADGVHVHPSWLRVAARSKNAGGVALITDAMAAAGTDATSFRLYGEEVVVRGGACFRRDGTLAGSVLTMDRAVALMHTLGGVPLIDCVRMATATPARVVGLEREIGVLRPGARGDVAVCDRELRVWRVLVGGEVAFAAAG